MVIDNYADLVKKPNNQYSKIKQFILLLPLVLFCSVLNGCQQPMTPADTWQARMVAAHGGSDALGRISTLVFSGRIATRGDRGTVTLILSRPGKLRTTMKYSRSYEERLLLGNRGWRNFGSGFEEAAGHSLAAMAFQYNHLSLLMGIDDGTYTISYSERKSGDTVFPALELLGADGPPMTVILHPETGLIQQIDGKIAMGDRQVIMAVGYSDYHEVSGVMLPHRIVNYVDGNAIAESRYDTVAVNPELDQNTFTLELPAGE